MSHFLNYMDTIIKNNNHKLTLEVESYRYLKKDNNQIIWIYAKIVITLSGDLIKTQLFIRS